MVLFGSRSTIPRAIQPYIGPWCEFWLPVDSDAEEKTAITTPEMRSRIPLIITAASFGSFLLAFAVAVGTDADYPRVIGFAVIIGLPWAALSSIHVTKNRVSFLCAIGCATVFSLVAVGSATDSLSAQIIISLSVIVTIALVETFPFNVWECLVFSFAVSIVRGFSPASNTGGILGLLEHQIPVLLPCAAVAVFGGLMTRHRELNVDLIADKEQLTHSTVALARANMTYQDYAVHARENAAELERQRITRDIHDVVGYALTNNMMLMESALDLMKENALALPRIIETARANAEEGIEQVRAAMYKLREQEKVASIGLAAIVRTTTVFEQATGIRIKCDFGNMPHTVSEAVDSAFFHVVQEALVNSFRHGSATEVGVQFWSDQLGYTVTVRDNGRGSAGFSAGIGLRGMRERIETLGGTIHAEGRPYGFVVSAFIPNKDTKK